METTPSPEKAPVESPALEALDFDFTTPAFARFCEEMDARLDQLVQQWQHLAAPRALRVGRMSNRKTPTA